MPSRLLQDIVQSIRNWKQICSLLQERYACHKVPPSCSSTQVILFSNETISDGHPEMSLQSQLIKPCSKALYVIQRGISPRMSGRGEGESFRAAKRCSCEVTSVFVAGVTALPQPLCPWQPPQAHSPWCCCLRTYYKVM